MLAADNPTDVLAADDQKRRGNRPNRTQSGRNVQGNAPISADHLGAGIDAPILSSSLFCSAPSGSHVEAPPYWGPSSSSEQATQRSSSSFRFPSSSEITEASSRQSPITEKLQKRVSGLENLRRRSTSCLISHSPISNISSSNISSNISSPNIDENSKATSWLSHQPIAPRGAYWREFVVPTGVTDDDEEISEDTDESSTASFSHPKVQHSQHPSSQRPPSQESSFSRLFNAGSEVFPGFNVRSVSAPQSREQLRTYSAPIENSADDSDSSIGDGDFSPLMESKPRRDGDRYASQNNSNAENIKRGHPLRNHSRIDPSVPFPSSFAPNLPPRHHIPNPYSVAAPPSPPSVFVTNPPPQSHRISSTLRSSMKSLAVARHPLHLQKQGFNRLTRRAPTPTTPAEFRSTRNSSSNGNSRQSVNPSNPGLSVDVEPLLRRPSSTSPASIPLPPLPGRRLRLLKFQALFLLFFVGSVLLGTLLHHAKVYRVRPTLSIDGFEKLLEVNPSAELPRRRLNLGALIAADLLLWMELPVDTEECETPSWLATSIKGQCGVNEDVFCRDYFAGKDLAGATQEDLGEGGNLAGKASGGLYGCLPSVALASVASRYPTLPSLRVARNLLEMEGVCIAPRYCKPLRPTGELVETLQKAVDKLAWHHPKLASLRLLFEPSSLGASTCSNSAGMNSTADPSDGAQMVLGCGEHHSASSFLDRHSLQLYAVGNAFPKGLLDHVVWFIQGTPVSKLLSATTKKLGLQGEAERSTCTSFVQPGKPSFPDTNWMDAIQVNWAIHQSPFVSIGRPVIASDIPLSSYTPPWVDSQASQANWILRLFRWSGGGLSPCYPLHDFLHWLFHSAVVYVVLLLSWIPCVVSPQPVTLVHSPRLLIHCCIAGYRGIVLYFLAGFLEEMLGKGLDFSDHLVLDLMIGMVLCIECTAAERSHERRIVRRKKQASWSSLVCRFIPFWKPAEPTSLIDASAVVDPQNQQTQESNFVVKSSIAVMNGLASCCNSDTDENVAECEAAQKDFSEDSDEETVCVWPLPVRLVHWYSLVICCFVCYAGFFTGLYFHHPLETIMGLVVGILGLFVPFWLMLCSGCLSLDRLGILKGKLGKVS